MTAALIGACTVPIIIGSDCYDIGPQHTVLLVKSCRVPTIIIRIGNVDFEIIIIYVVYILPACCWCLKLTLLLTAQI